MTLRTFIAALVVFATTAVTGFVAFDHSAAQEVEPKTLTVRVSNPFDLYGNLFVVCGFEARKLGLVLPEATTTLDPRVVDLTCGHSEFQFGVVLENGGFSAWEGSALNLDDPTLKGVLVCIRRDRSGLFRFPESREVPPLCPDRSPSSSLEFSPLVALLRVA